MADVIPGTVVNMRIVRRFSHYNVGDTISVDFWAGKELEAKRLAQPLGLLVPVAAARAGEPPDPVPQRQPGSMVRK